MGRGRACTGVIGPCQGGWEGLWDLMMAKGMARVWGEQVVSEEERVQGRRRGWERLGLQHEV